MTVAYAVRPPVPPPAGNIVPASKESRLIVYAIVRARRSAPVRTRTGEPLSLVASGPIAGVVQRRSRPLASSPVNLRRYDRTLHELAEQFDALLPARFGTVMPADELVFILESRRDALVRALVNVRGKAQMTVRVVDGAAKRAEMTPTGPDVKAASGRDYLLARARAAAAQRAVPGFEPVRAAVERFVRDERVEHARGVSTFYHLIPRASAERYRQAVERAARAAGLRVVVSGPWPPYAFAVAD